MLIIQQKNPLHCRLDEFAHSFNLTQIISKPTRVTETKKSYSPCTYLLRETVMNYVNKTYSGFGSMSS